MHQHRSGLELLDPLMEPLLRAISQRSTMPSDSRHSSDGHTWRQFTVDIECFNYRTEVTQKLMTLAVSTHIDAISVEQFEQNMTHSLHESNESALGGFYGGFPC